MRLHRFFGNFNFLKSPLVITDPELISQIVNVLRLQAKDDIILCDGKYNEAICQITGIAKDKIELKLINVQNNQNESGKQVILYCAILKKENFEVVVQKAVETGVVRIVPVLTDRTVKLNINPERINRIIKEAAEQSGRGILSKLENPVSLAQIGQHSGGNDLNIFFEKSRVLFMDWIIENGELLKKTSKIGIFIGPEGGWTKEEIEIAKTNNYHIISLGNFVLRAETAAIIASYLLVNS